MAELEELSFLELLNIANEGYVVPCRVATDLAAAAESICTAAAERLPELQFKLF
jgi:hypothetical protein